MRNDQGQRQQDDYQHRQYQDDQPDDGGSQPGKADQRLDGILGDPDRFPAPMVIG
jgi:hypothetical protein